MPANDSINFVLTNRLPRALLTRFMGWFSKIENPLISRPAIWLWQRFSPLDLSEARKRTFRSIHDCFTRELVDGARPLADEDGSWVSPCDGIVGEHGRIEAGTLLQAKGMTYTLAELLQSEAQARVFEGGSYLTIRITASMYHRFHAPTNCHVSEVIYHSGDTWNVNPPALARVDRLFCKNERAVIRCELADGRPMLLIPVAAILVAGIRLHCIDTVMNLRYRGANHMTADADVVRGDEMGWFEHGSTIIACLPEGAWDLSGITVGQQVRARQSLLPAL